MSKLCAMVTMQKQGQTNAQLFSLPLVPRTDQPVDTQPQPPGNRIYNYLKTADNIYSVIWI